MAVRSSQGLRILPSRNVERTDEHCFRISLFRLAAANNQAVRPASQDFRAHQISSSSRARDKASRSASPLPKVANKSAWAGTVGLTLKKN